MDTDALPADDAGTQLIHVKPANEPNEVVLAEKTDKEPSGEPEIRLAVVESMTIVEESVEKVVEPVVEEVVEQTVKQTEEEQPQEPQESITAITKQFGNLRSEDSANISSCGPTESEICYQQLDNFDTTMMDASMIPPSSPWVARPSSPPPRPPASNNTLFDSLLQSLNQSVHGSEANDPTPDRNQREATPEPERTDPDHAFSSRTDLEEGEIREKKDAEMDDGTEENIGNDSGFANMCTASTFSSLTKPTAGTESKKGVTPIPGLEGIACFDTTSVADNFLNSLQEEFTEKGREELTAKELALKKLEEYNSIELSWRERREAARKACLNVPVELPDQREAFLVVKETLPVRPQDQATEFDILWEAEQRSKREARRKALAEGIFPPGMAPALKGANAIPVGASKWSEEGDDVIGRPRRNSKRKCDDDGPDWRQRREEFQTKSQWASGGLLQSVAFGESKTANSEPTAMVVEEALASLDAAPAGDASVTQDTTMEEGVLPPEDDPFLRRAAIKWDQYPPGTVVVAPVLDDAESIENFKAQRRAQREAIRNADRPRSISRDPKPVPPTIEFVRAKSSRLTPPPPPAQGFVRRDPPHARKDGALNPTAAPWVAAKNIDSLTATQKLIEQQIRNVNKHRQQQQAAHQTSAQQRYEQGKQQRYNAGMAPAWAPPTVGSGYAAAAAAAAASASAPITGTNQGYKPATSQTQSQPSYPPVGTPQLPYNSSTSQAYSTSNSQGYQAASTSQGYQTAAPQVAYAYGPNNMVYGMQQLGYTFVAPMGGQVVGYAQPYQFGQVGGGSGYGQVFVPPAVTQSVSGYLGYGPNGQQVGLEGGLQQQHQVYSQAAALQQQQQQPRPQQPAPVPVSQPQVGGQAAKGAANAVGPVYLDELRSYNPPIKVESPFKIAPLLFTAHLSTSKSSKLKLDVNFNKLQHVIVCGSAPGPKNLSRASPPPDGFVGPKLFEAKRMPMSQLQRMCERRIPRGPMGRNPPPGAPRGPAFMRGNNTGGQGGGVQKGGDVALNTYELGVQRGIEIAKRELERERDRHRHGHHSHDHDRHRHGERHGSRGYHPYRDHRHSEGRHQSEGGQRKELTLGKPRPGPVR
ncbi:hypothetical protein BJ508DRAFT_336317 [Ascobolus immersus RN42]|uniref:Uncharacterized protein n=1 Tax=Ascobolus immersus RN42 TaxID=1160509 RepID=A0A3N4H8Y8_ASCIM|nr:hypothetical protein BJ508DRAFT_336317 [Ascobolus immersus RN42]